MAFKKPSWVMPDAVIVDLRELKTKEGKLWAYSVKVEVRGGTYEASIPLVEEKFYKTLGVGMLGEVVGGFEQYQGNIKLQMTAFTPES